MGGAQPFFAAPAEESLWTFMPEPLLRAPVRRVCAFEAVVVCLVVSAFAVWAGAAAGAAAGFLAGCCAPATAARRARAGRADRRGLRMRSGSTSGGRGRHAGESRGRRIAPAV